MPGVLMIEALTQAAGVLRARSGRRAAECPRRAPRRQQREVPAPGRARRSPAAGSHTRSGPLPAGESSGGGVHRRPGGRRSRTAARDRARAGVHRSHGPRPPVGAHRRGHVDRSERRPSVRTSRIGANCRIGASVVIEGWTEVGDDTQIFPMASIGLAPQDLKYRGERTRLVIGKGNIFREFVTINRGTLGGGGETTIGDHNLFMAYVHVAHDCHVGQRHDLRPARHARRARGRRGLRQHQRRVRRPPVLPGGEVRVHRRLLGGDQGRAAVRAHHRQPSGAYFRRQHHRVVAARLHHRHDLAVEAGLSLSDSVEAEHHARAGDASTRIRRCRRPRSAIWWISSAARAAA